MLETLLSQPPVTAPAVGENVAAWSHLGLEKSLQGVCGRIGNHFQRGEARNWFLARFAGATLLHSHGHHGLVLGAAPASSRAVLGAAHVSLVGLDKAAEPVAPITIRHRLAELVQQQPGGLIADPDLLAQLDRKSTRLNSSHL